MLIMSNWLIVFLKFFIFIEFFLIQSIINERVMLKSLIMIMDYLYFPLGLLILLYIFESFIYQVHLNLKLFSLWMLPLFKIIIYTFIIRKCLNLFWQYSLS